MAAAGDELDVSDDDAMAHTEGQEGCVGRSHAGEAAESGASVARQPARAALRGGRKGPARKGGTASPEPNGWGCAITIPWALGASSAGSNPGVSGGGSLWACEGRSSRW